MEAQHKMPRKSGMESGNKGHELNQASARHLQESLAVSSSSGASSFLFM
jgi:hypothetical protein